MMVVLQQVNIKTKASRKRRGWGGGVVPLDLNWGSLTRESGVFTFTPRSHLTNGDTGKERKHKTKTKMKQE